MATYKLPFSANLLTMRIGHNPPSHVGIYAYAMDFLVPAGTSVNAPRGGKIIAVGSVANKDGLAENAVEGANYVLIEHSDGERTLLAHLETSNIRVHVGDTVETGEMVALQGSNDAKEIEPCIHMSVHRNGQSIPIEFQIR